MMSLVQEAHIASVDLGDDRLGDDEWNLLSNTASLVSAASCISHSLNQSLVHYYLLFIYCTVHAHVKSFTMVKNRKCGQVTSHCRKARPYRADLSLFLNVPVVTVKS